MRRDALVYLILASAAFSMAGPLARLARPAHPMAVAAGRVAIAALILLALEHRTLAQHIRKLTARQRAGIFGAGALLAVHFALFLWGLDETSLPAAMSLVSLEPLSVVVCAYLVHRIKPTRGEQVGVVVATLGAFVITLGAGEGEHRLLGDLLVLGAVVLFGLYVAAARGLKDALPTRPYAALVYASATIVLVPLVLLFPGAGPSALTGIPSESVLFIAALGVVPTVIGHTMVQSAARRLSPAIVALVCPGETLGAIAIGAALLGAVPTGVEIAGALVIIAGAAIALVTSRDPGTAGDRAHAEATVQPSKSKKI